MAFRIGGNVRRIKRSDDEDAATPVLEPLVMEQPLWPTIPVPHEVDRLFAQVFALVGEGIAGATHALLSSLKKRTLSRGCRRLLWQLACADEQVRSDPWAR
jgi:hypothetical protein